MALGWLYVADVKVAGNKRKGVMVNWAVTPWAHEFTGNRPDQSSMPRVVKSVKSHSKPFDETGLGALTRPAQRARQMSLRGMEI